MAKTVRPYHLTPSEETIMQILWESKEPLTQQQIVDTAESKGILCWKARSVFCLLNSLIGKKLIEEVGMVRAGKTYARTFSSTITRPEFYAKSVTFVISNSSPSSQITRNGMSSPSGLKSATTSTYFLHRCSIYQMLPCKNPCGCIVWSPLASQ